nr:ABC transporter permease [Lachnospiraceae bacterium]
MKAMWRRDWILFRRGLIPALILTLLLGLASSLAAYAVTNSAKESAAPVEVALVDEEGGVLSRMAVNVVSSQSFIASLVDFQQTKREEALDGLNKGRYEAVIILPEGYIDQIRYGWPGTGQIILSKAAAASADVVASLAKFGELLLAGGQYGIFAGEELIQEKGLSEEFHQYFLDKSNDELFDQAFSIYDDGILRETAPYSGTGLTTDAYYAAAWISFFLLLCGLFFPALYTKDTRKSVLTRLYSLSVTPGGYLSGKLLFPFLFRLPLTAAILAVLSRHFSLRFTPGALLWALLGVVMASALISFASVALGQKKGWQGLLMGIAAVCLFLCGGLIPRSMLPAWVTQIGRFTPLGAVLSAFKPLFGGKADVPSILAGLLLTAAAGFLAWRHLTLMPQKGDES